MFENFKLTKEENELVLKIADRAVAFAAKRGDHLDKLDVCMDLTATHCNGNPLRLKALLEADDFDFVHDVFGISNYMNRRTAKLTNFFEPRFTDYKKLKELKGKE